VHVGTYADGRLALGGYATEHGGTIEMTALVGGAFDDQGFTALAKSLSLGTCEDDDGTLYEIDCRGEHEVTATWEASLDTD